MDAAGKLVFLSVPGNHLQFTDKFFKEEPPTNICSAFRKKLELHEEQLNTGEEQNLNTWEDVFTQNNLIYSVALHFQV